MQASTTKDDYPAHWRLGCSNAKRWVNCPGSQWAEDDSEPGEMAVIGSLAHKLAEQLLCGELPSMTPEERELFDSLEETEQDWIRTAIKRVVEFVGEKWAEIKSADAEMRIELKIKSDVIPDHGGTMDVLMVTREMLHVIDFKFGAVAVDASENEQLSCYLNLARQKYPGRKKFYGTIVQPSYRGPDTVEFTEDDLDDFLFRAAEAAVSEHRRADPAWCQYCPLLATCEESGKRSARSVEEFGTLSEFVNQAHNPPTEEDVERLERIVMMHRLAKEAFDKASTLLKKWHNDGAKLKHHRMSSTTIRNWRQDKIDELIELLPEDVRGEVITTSVASPKALQDRLGFKKKDFDGMFSDMMDLTNRPTLRAGTKPTPRELVLDLPFHESK